MGSLEEQLRLPAIPFSLTPQPNPKSLWGAPGEVGRGNLLFGEISFLGFHGNGSSAGLGFPCPDSRGIPLGFSSSNSCSGLGFRDLGEEKLRVGKIPDCLSPESIRSFHLAVPNKAWLYPGGSLCFPAHPDSPKNPLLSQNYPSWKGLYPNPSSGNLNLQGFPGSCDLSSSRSSFLE